MPQSLRRKLELGGGAKVQRSLSWRAGGGSGRSKIAAELATKLELGGGAKVQRSLSWSAGAGTGRSKSATELGEAYLA